MSRTPVTKIQAYQTTDGKIFTSYHDAIEYQNAIDFDDWYEEHTLMPGMSNSEVDVEIFKEYVKKYADRIKFLLD